MGKIRGLLFAFLGSLLVSGMFGIVETYAAPVNPSLGKVMFQQPDGKTFMGEIKGDEHFNYVVVEGTSDIVIQGKDNYWYYAQKGEEKKK